MLSFSVFIRLVRLLGDTRRTELILSHHSLSLSKISNAGVPPGLFPLSEPHSSQPLSDLQTDQKQTVWFSLQSPFGLHVPPDSNQNSALGCNQTDPDHWSGRLF